jgi:hypothetical protein
MEGMVTQPDLKSENKNQPFPFTTKEQSFQGTSHKYVYVYAYKKYKL